MTVKELLNDIISNTKTIDGVVMFYDEESNGFKKVKIESIGNSLCFTLSSEKDLKEDFFENV